MINSEYYSIASLVQTLWQCNVGVTKEMDLQGSGINSGRSILDQPVDKNVLLLLH